MTPLLIQTKKMEPDITVLEFAGKIRMGPDCQRVEEIVLDLLSQSNKKFIFDLSAVEYVDSSGMGSIAYCFAKVTRAEGGLRVAGLDERLKPLFRMTRMDTVIAFYPTVLAAAQSPW